MPNSTINATTNGLNSTAGNVATLDLQVAGSTVASATSGGVAITGTLSASGATTLSGAVSASSLSVNSNNISADNSLGFRNRIINGDMRIDQRNAGAAVTINTAAFTYSLDRWRSFGATTDGVFTIQQDTSTPAGFVNSAKITVTTADASIDAAQGYNFQQCIEGTNISDLAWGSASAKTVTLSFWVRSSLTGTFGGAIRNDGNTRTYPFSYTISSANTWEQKTVTVAGDTTGTWLTTTGIGINVLFSLGAGSDFLTTGGSWNATNRQGVTGQVQVIGTLNATWYITGVQLEVGSTATPFERRPYGTELALCQRYYEKSYSQDVVPGTNTAAGLWRTAGSSDSANNLLTCINFRVTKRATPTMTFYREGGTSGSWYYERSGASGNTTMNTWNLNDARWGAYNSVGAAWVTCFNEGHWVASAEL